jgi:putative FmdB family regulatory protein
MPTYEYVCRACEHAFETMHGMTAPVLRKCPKCGKMRLQRLISGGAGVIFKGSGFYETDYKRNRGGGGAQESDAKQKKAEESAKSETKSDAKPDAAAQKKDAKSESRGEAKSGGEAKPEPKPKKDSGPKKD